MRASSSNSDHHSCCSDSDGGYDEWISSWSDEDSHYSSGPRSDGSWEGDSFFNSYTRGYGNCDSDYDSISSE